ncbi:MAG: hypothetical protein ACNS62_19235 [Candidatus Cyclobacteriaceae bacterium M3_2C_046]
MKNRILIYLLAGVTVLLSNACGSEDEVAEIPQGAMVYFNQNENDTPFIDFLDLNNTNLDFTVSFEDAIGRDLEFEPVEYVDITMLYTNTSEGTTHKVVVEQVNSLPKSYTITLDQLLGLYDPSEVARDTLQPGDNLQVTVDIMLQNGTFLSGWSGALIDKTPASIYSVLIDYPVTCSSSLAGTYTLKLVEGANGEVQELKDVNITEIGPGQYMIDDITMDIFGPDFPIAYPFSDVCGQIVPGAQSRDFGSAVVVKDAGGSSVNLETGEITFNLEYIAPSCCGLEGLKFKFTAVPQ